VLEDGQIVERGTHPELMELDGLYRRHYEKQYGLVRDLFINPGEEPPEEGDGRRSEVAQAVSRVGSRSTLRARASLAEGVRRSHCSWQRSSFS